MANLALTESLNVDVIVHTFLEYLSRLVPFEEYLIARQNTPNRLDTVSTLWGESLNLACQWLYIPLQFGAYHIGACVLGLPLTPPLLEEDKEVLAALAAQAASAVQNALLAITDELTGLLNRRAFFDRARREFDRAKRYKKPLAAIMIDLDHFKQVNDTYSHAVGDQVLTEVALRIRETVRTLDIVGRYGGEEISIVAPETSLKGALQLAERLRCNIGTVPIETSAGFLHVTVSVGVATWLAAWRLAGIDEHATGRRGMPDGLLKTTCSTKHLRVPERDQCIIAYDDVVGTVAGKCPQGEQIVVRIVEHQWSR